MYFSLRYNTELFRLETANSILEHYLFVLNSVLNDEKQIISNIPIMTGAELSLLEKFNSTDDAINEDTFISIFENEVKNNPDNIALICEDKTLTYNELNMKANSLAHTKPPVRRVVLILVPINIQKYCSLLLKSSCARCKIKKMRSIFAK